MKPTVIDPKTTTRAAAFDLWMNAPNPMVTFFKTLDVTPLVRLSRRRGLKFNVLLCWCMNERKRRKTMSKRARQYIGILAAVIAYYLVHEGAHLLYALFTGVFRQIKFMGLGVQVDVFRERMTDTQFGIFCLVGAVATFCIAYVICVRNKKARKVER